MKCEMHENKNKKVWKGFTMEEDAYSCVHTFWGGLLFFFFSFSSNDEYP